MIQFNFKQLLADKEFKEKRRISIKEISETTGISRTTLSKIANSKGDYRTSTEYIEKICTYFDVAPDQLIKIIPDPPDK